MTNEERMIRVNEQGASMIWKALVRYTGTPGDRFMGNPIFWEELELAPPKDWKPYCYDFICDFPPKEFVSWGDECWNCPYRKRE